MLKEYKSRKIVFLDMNSSDKRAPVKKACSVLRLRMVELPAIWEAPANILNNSRGQPKRVGPPASGKGEELTTTTVKKTCLCYRT
jgi:hypothetical protein